MTTEFSFEHTFRAPSVDAVVRAYFNPEHLAAQDQVAELADRQVVEERDDETTRTVSWTVVSKKPLPVFARPFVDGGKLAYRETMTWRKAASEIDLVITPQIMNGRVKLAATYQLALVAPGSVRRRYQGNVSVDIRFLGGKIERAVVAEIEKGIPLMFQCTQDWLGAHPDA